MSPGRHPSAPELRRRDQVVLEPGERRAAMLRVIAKARRRLMLSLFRCDDFAILDALAAALDRGVTVHAILTRRARGGRKSLKRLWEALEGMGASVSWFADPVVKYHAKYLIADDGPAIVTTLNPTRKCFTRTWDAVVITYDSAIVNSLEHLFEADVGGRTATLERRFSRRLIIGPERARDGIHALIAGAARSIRILDHKLSDPEVVALLRDRREEGVTVSVIGAMPVGPLEWHGKLMIVDESRAVLGSMALSTLGLDFRREVGIVVDDAAAVRRLNVSYQQLLTHAGPLANRLPGDKP